MSRTLRLPTLTQRGTMVFRGLLPAGKQFILFGALEKNQFIPKHLSEESG